MNPAENVDLPVSPVNRRITWLILGFAALSLGASVLPLMPSVSSFLPFGLMDRRGEMALYSVFLVMYMALVFPTTLLPPLSPATGERRKQRAMAWWWVGFFMLAFSGVPLFVLAYIAGVSFKGVVAVLLWAGVFHGMATFWTCVFGFRSRPILVALNFLIVGVIPLLSHFGTLLGGKDALNSPITLILGMTRHFAEPELFLPGGLCFGIYGGLWALCFLSKSRVALSLLFVVASVFSFGFSGPNTGAVLREDSQQKSSPMVRSITQGRHVAGRVFPLEVSAKPGEVVKISVGGGTEITWSPKNGSPSSLWFYPTIESNADPVCVNVDGLDLARIKLDAVSPRQSLVLFFDIPKVGSGPSWVGIPFLSPRPFLSPLGYDPFGGVVLTEERYLQFSVEERAVLRTWAETGGHLVILGAKDPGGSTLGQGRVLRRREMTLPNDFSPQLRSRHVNESNLYSSFALPDWGKVDLTRLLLFLGIYHAVFYVIFLLPLIFDAKKSLAVYLVSVAFVLTLVVVGSYYTLKRVFLADNQVLQQNLCTWRGALDEEGGLTLFQETCFASFNGSPSDLTFQRAHSPRLVPVPGVGLHCKQYVTPSGEQITVSGFILDRFAGKQVVKMGQQWKLPFTVQIQGRTVSLRPRPGVKDESGLLTAERLAAFYRQGGQLYGAELRGQRIQVAKTPDSLIWQGVLPENLREAGILPFLRYGLGRHTHRDENVLVILMEGANSLHDGSDYLSRRDLLQMLVIPVDLSMK